MTMVRNGLGLALVAGLISVAPAPALARTHAQRLSSSDSQTLHQAHFAETLLNKFNAGLNKEEGAIATQNRLIIREEGLLTLVPANSQQALRIQKQFNINGIQINRLQNAINAGANGLVNLDGQANNVLSVVSSATVVNPTLAQQISDYLSLAYQRLALEEAQLDKILNRPAATPYVPFD